jgi:hypothetical protein
LEEVTKEWDIYEGEKIGLSFRYPKEWSVSQVVGKKPFRAFVYSASRPLSEEESLIKVTSLGKIDGSLESWLKKRHPAGVEEIEFGERTWLRPSEDKLLEEGYNNLFIVGAGGRGYNLVFEIVEDEETYRLVEALFSTLKFL